MLQNEQRCINVKSAVGLITTDHPLYRAETDVLKGTHLLGNQGIIDAYLIMIGRCFVKQPYFFCQTSGRSKQAKAMDGSCHDIDILFTQRLMKMTVQLRRHWMARFEKESELINWKKFCTDGVMEHKLVSATAEPFSTPAHSITRSRYLDSAFNDFHTTANRYLQDVITALHRFDLDDRVEVTSILKRTLSFNDARVICLMFRDLHQFDTLKARLIQARLALHQQPDLGHLIEYERHIHSLLTAQLMAYARLLYRYNSNSQVRDWSYVSEFFTGVHARSLERYHCAIFIPSVLYGLFSEPVNRDLLTLQVSLLHRQMRVFFVHDLVMRYLIRRYFTKARHPKLTVHPFEERGALDYERLRFFMWLVNRALMDDSCYQSDSVVDDAEFWRQVLGHCAVLSPSTFVAQLFRYIAPLDVRFPVSAHDLLDYVEWLCGYDPWYLCYANGIIERFRLFSENKLQKQFSALYESECLLFYILITNRLRHIEDKIRFLRARPELQQLSTLSDARDPHQPAMMFNYTHSATDHQLPSMALPVFNWFNLSSNLFNYGVYYETLDWCTKTVQHYFAYVSRQSMQSSPRTDAMSSAPLDSVWGSQSGVVISDDVTRKRPAPELAIPTDSLFDMINQPSRSKRSRHEPAIDFVPMAEDEARYDSQDNDSTTTSQRGSDDHSDLSGRNTATQWQRSPRNKYFSVSLLQNCMGFLNDICLMYNGSLIHKGCAENKHNYKQSHFKDRLKQSNDAWKNEPDLMVYNITWKELDLHKLEESCYREKSEEYVSKAIGNTLAACSTSQINVYYLRIRNDSKHGYVIFNTMLRRYEIAAPSLMYLLSLDYKNWHLSDSDGYPSAVDVRVRDYISIALSEIDHFVAAVVPIDAVSMMLNSNLIYEKSIGTTVTVLQDQGSRGGQDHQRAAEDQPVLEGIDPADNNDSGVPAPASDVNAMPFEERSYVDFTIDRSEFFELSQHVQPHWIYRYMEQLLLNKGDRAFIYLVWLIVQMIHHYGVWIVDRESWITMMTEELLLSALPSDIPSKWRAKKKMSLPRSRSNGGASGKKVMTEQANGQPVNKPVYTPRCDLSRLLEDQFHNCLVLDEQVMARYQSSYRRDPVLLTGSSALPAGITAQDEAVNEKQWQTVFKRDGSEPNSHTSLNRGGHGSMVRDLLIEQDMRHFFSSTLGNANFYQWLKQQEDQIKLTDVIDLGDALFVRLFALFVYVIRIITKQPIPVEQQASPANESTPRSLAQHITQRAHTILRELRLFLPCRFIASRGTINLSDAFVDYLERRLLTIQTDAPQSSGHASNAITHIQEDDPFSVLLNSLNQESLSVSTVSTSEGEHESMVDSEHDRTTATIPYLRESALSYKARQSISYFIFFIYIFCNCDLSVTLYMLRFLVSFLYPGPWAKTVALVQGSSNSGKSNMFNLVRSFYNSDMAVLNPKALTGPKDNIGTEFQLMCENFVCQTEELKEVEAETIKTMTSDTPLQARSFHSQRQQTVGILASMVITLNQMFRVVSDEGVLERLRVIFRVTHRHLELVRKESDMTRVNCGASMNISHQFMRRIFPRGIVPEAFQRGMFYTIMNWCPSQVTSPDDRFTYADLVSARYLQTLLQAELPNKQSVYESAAQRGLRRFEMSREFGHRWQRTCCRHESSWSESRLLPTMKAITSAMDQCVRPLPLGGEGLTEFGLEPTSLSMIHHYIQGVDSFIDLLNLSQSRIEMRMSHAYQYTNCVTQHVQYRTLFNELRGRNLVTYLAQKLGRHPQTSSVIEQLERPCVNDDEYDDNHVNLMVKPYILDLYLADLHANIDSFVRFQNTHKITSVQVPIRKELLRYQLKIFVDRFNATIDDAKYRVKFNEFFDRFETEYERFKYRDPHTNQIVPDQWAICVRQLSDV